jgi:putative transposase
MPRAARLDIQGLLQHVIVRGIEKRDIFLDEEDREAFFARFGKLLLEMDMDCFAWALLSNHAHFLLRPRGTKLADFMRRLLTGYAVNFNLRHHRSGHLFQNRYKSIVCQADPYFLELVRYIHLNPWRAGFVREMKEFDHYRWSGHAVLMGYRDLPGQRTDEVLGYFGKGLKTARRHYRKFILEGVGQGRRNELVGGGLKRSRKLIGFEGMEAYDDRVLGNGEFVEQLRREKELSARLPVVMPLKDLAEKVAGIFGLDLEDLKKRNRSSKFSEARSVISYLGVRQIGHNGVEVARFLNMSRAGVSVAARRGEKLVRGNPSLQQIIQS